MTKYTKLSILGSGTFGQAWVIQSVENIGERNVLKEVNLSNLNKKDINQAITEAELLAGCKHENIIMYKEAFITREPYTLCIVMEYASNGDLHKCITQRNGLFFLNETISEWLGQIMSALAYIHSRNILHRDIKPQNLFLSDQNTLKLGDFGIARILQEETDKALTFIGTPFYISPEIYNQRPYSFKSDMWSAGCVLYELCCLHLPFSALSLGKLAAKIENGAFSPLPSHCDQILHVLIKRLLNPDPEERPSAQTILDMLTATKKESCRKQLPNDADSHDSQLSERGRNRLRHADSEDVHNKTYRVVRPPKVKKTSLASPELSSLLHHQRMQSAERNRSSSADGVHKPQLQKKKEPQCNILQSPLASETENNCPNDVKTMGADGDMDAADSSSMTNRVARCMYKFYQLSPSGLCAKDAHRCLEVALGKEEIQRLVSAIRQKKSFEELRSIYGVECTSLLPVLLLYVNLLDKA